jgi:hypothetical protein
MRYYVTFQYMPKGSARPLDQGTSAGDFEWEGKTGFPPLPAVGDFYHAVDVSKDQDHVVFSGRVRSRLFTYLSNGDCSINIVVQETDDDWGLLIKE